jgi:hypothetical protein
MQIDIFRKDGTRKVDLPVGFNDVTLYKDGVSYKTVSGSLVSMDKESYRECLQEWFNIPSSFS